MKGFTVQERKNVVENIITKFNTHLVSPRPPGSVLNNSECLGVAKCAREAIFSPSLDELPASVCLRPGSFYATMQEFTCKFPSSIDISEEKGDFLAKTIHAIVGHQHRLDENWYKMTLKEILKIFEGGKGSMEEESVRVRCHQIFCEIMTIAVASCAIQMTYMALNEDIPALPSEEEAEKATKSSSPVEEFDMMSFLTKVNWTTTVSDWSPYYTEKEINMESEEWKSLSESDQKWFLRSLSQFSPRICSYLAPFDAKIMMEVMCCLYIEDVDKKIMTTFHNKCDGVTRSQVEAVAAGYAGAVNCAF